MYNKLVLLLIVIVCIVTIRGQAGAASPAATAGTTDYTSEMTAANTYDYIVVGVGQTGSTVSRRLVDGGKRVFGVEAGVVTHASLGGIDFVASRYASNPDGTYTVIQPPLTRFDVPQLYTTAYLNPTPYPDWPMFLNGVVADSTVGKLLGGSAAHNGMIWLRHTKTMMDAWNITGWSYNDCLPFFQKSENITGSNETQYPQFHGFSGPIQISDNPVNEYYSAVPILKQACNQTLGLPMNYDFNGPTRYGCGTQVFSIGRGIRQSAANSYLPSIINNKNFTLSLSSEVTRILIKAGPPTASSSAARSPPVAYGVEYVKGGVTTRVFAKYEVVLTASAILTPKLMLLSGIGNTTTLTKLGIHTWLNAPNVGQNLRVNQLIFGAWNWPAAVYPNGLKVSQALIQYAINGSGPWSHPGQYMYAYDCTAPGPCKEPNFMIGTAVGGFSTTVSSGNTISTQVSTAQPKAVGAITLHSASYTDGPDLDMDFFGNPDDLNAMIAGIKLLRKMFNGTICQAAGFTTEASPGPTVVNDTEIGNYIKANGQAGYHWVGTTKMGNSTDTTNVVDTTMKVIGITGLRIGDTSVLPTVTTHLQASASMVAERCADFILRGT